MTTDRDWMLHAECRNHPPDDWFPSPRDKHGQAHAQRICITCPVFDQCAEYRRTTRPTHGIWAARFLNEQRNFTTSHVLNGHGTIAAYRRHKRAGQTPCPPCEQAGARANAEDRARKQARRANR